ncbi:MAG TPA: methyl-accepting chemotaxis protein [Hypericibacter adhaerens]|uniref:HAMP domain-containing methyl-accepting chemotaxis protein n=1 Tax=Hypericibacter adhaerens TaxID=2602016 RepID=UPI002BD9991D|nr:methyl-accepting chemotaxis protein [Hypericibacter adhaerens]HWA44758.1 methyl-accepting chemotaxis protein [Hypericibacter adhaerens]
MSQSLRFSNLKIGTRLALGISVILVLLSAVGAISFVSLGSANGKFQEYQSAAHQTVAACAIETDLLRTNIAVTNFIGDDNDADLTAAREASDETLKAIEGSIALFNDTDAERQNIGSIESAMKDYMQGFEQIVTLSKQSDGLLDRLNDAEAKVDSDLTAIMNAAASSGEADATDKAGEAINHLLVARLDVAKYLGSNDPALAKSAKAELQAVVGQAQELRALIHDVKLQSDADEVAGGIKAFADAFDAEQADIEARNEIVSDKLQKIAPDMRKKLDETITENQTVEEELGPQTTEEMKDTRWTAVTLSIVAVVAGLLIAFFTARSITRPVVGMTKAMESLAGGNKTIEIPGRERADEVGQMAKTVQVFKESMIRADQLAAEQEELKRKAEADKKAMLNQMADSFEASVKGVVEAVSSAATELQSSAQSMSATAEQTNRQSTAVAAASEEASTNVQTVASASEELTASIREISQQMTNSSQIAREAVDNVERTNQTVKGLAEAAERIGQVVGLINEIASQTNLLALNATIEAARAGEAGKGFAVVASEVKSLATQTAKATEEIGGQIAAIQTATGQSVAAMNGIAEVMQRINAVTATVASAVEEQGAATQEISRNVQQASVGTTEVSSNIAGVTLAAGETGKAAGQVLTAAAELGKQSVRLQREVDEFIGTIRAA